MSFPRYPEYKDSSDPWLGEVPAHWNSASLRWVTTRYAGGTPDKLNQDYWVDGTVPWLNSGAVNQGLISEPSAFITQDAYENSSAKWIPEGALVMALAGQGKTKGMVAQLAIASTCNQSMAAIVPNDEVAPRYLYWWLTSNYQNVRNMAGGDLRDGLNLELLGNIPCPLLPIKEQFAIATFLDRETAKIDALVAEQEKLIALLKEKRQAVISHAVSKGIDPNATMKDSGVAWLGKVPAHWKISQSRRLFSERKDRAFGEDRQLTASQKHGVIYQDEFMALEGQKVVQVIHGADILKHVEPNDFVISMRSFQGGIEWCGLPGSISSAYVMLIPSESIVPGFFRYLFKSSSYIQALQSTTNLVRDGQALRYANFTLVDLPVVPVDEQTAIAAFLDQETAKFDALTAEAEKGIALLKERRSALITAAVTGKIDVRGVAGQVESASHETAGLPA